MQVVSDFQPIRVAFVTGGLMLGGSTTFLVNLAGELVSRGIATEIFSFNQTNPLAADFQRLNIPVQTVNEHRLIFEDRMERLLAGMARFKPTVVVANLGSDSFEVFRYLPLGIFRLGVVHSDDDRVYHMVQHYLQIMDGLAMVSRSILERLQAHAVFANLPLYQLTLGVSMPDASHVVQPDAFRPLRILYLGRLEQEQKRVRLFPPIWQQLCASGISCHWTIAGNGPEMAFLKESLKNNPPHQTITFLGVVPYVKVSDVLREHDVFLLASDYEGLPLSLLEAMGHGLVPVVSLLKSGIPEVVDDTNGLLVPINDVAGYARAIIHLHEHREELATKAAAARTRVQTHFSVTAMTDRWLATFPPPPPNLSIIWPQLWQIFSPLTAKKQVLFSPPVRILRRAAKQLQTFLK